MNNRFFSLAALSFAALLAGCAHEHYHARRPVHVAPAPYVEPPPVGYVTPTYGVEPVPIYIEGSHRRPHGGHDYDRRPPRRPDDRHHADKRPPAPKKPAPVAKPASKPAPKPVAKPAPKPMPKPGVKPAPKPIAKPGVKPAPKPMSRPMTQPATKPTPAKPSAKPAVAPKPVASKKPKVAGSIPVSRTNHKSDSDQ